MRRAAASASIGTPHHSACTPAAIRVVVFGSWALYAACAGHGLPPAGPGPGEVDIGYGTARATDVTGALTTVDEETAGVTGALTIADLLRGRVPGLQVEATAAGATYRIRGMADQQPLFVVDGVPTLAENLMAAMAGVVMEDVRQIDVLRDVASTSVFGSRGAGGVIIITTRR